jgi:hypothetical protein
VTESDYLPINVGLGIIDRNTKTTPDTGAFLYYYFIRLDHVGKIFAGLITCIVYLIYGVYSV